jgi:competence protein ComFB
MLNENLPEDIKLRNFMEEVVEMVYDEIIDDLEVCKCKKCEMDIIALALNNLPSAYVVTARGEIFSKVNLLKGQFEVDAISAITTAAAVINQNPRHNDVE